MPGVTATGKPSRPWAGLFWLTVIAAYGYILLEWLFVVTKVSFLSTLSFFARLQILFFAGGLLAGLCLVILLVLFGVGRLPGIRTRPQWGVKLAALLPAGVLACLILIVADNFTYTLFRFGVATSAGLGRIIYTVLFLIALAAMYRAILRELPRPGRALQRLSGRPWIVAALLVMLLPVLFSLATNEPGPGFRPAKAVRAPVNILYLTSDALQADNMSLYGYRRETTPFLSKLAETSLLVENAFTNCNNTGGSLMAAYIGKYPADTRMISAPDILRGQDAYQHLPGLLHAAGYHTAQFSAPYFGDAYALNMLQGFDQVNERSIPVDSLVSRASAYLPVDFSYFIIYTTSRIADRLSHIFFIKDMDNPYDIVSGGSLLTGELHMRDFLRFIEQARGPFFVHIHFLNTHGSVYYIDEQVFSAGKDRNRQQLWDLDFYDDAILSFDREVETIVGKLKQQGLYDRTVLIIGSDHGFQWDPVRKIPLLIHFPNGEHAGRYHANAQVIDIAPTVLDYLGVPVPPWMQGHSLLQPEQPDRPIFIAGAQSIETDLNAGSLIMNRYSPPFYQFGGISLIYCQRWYTLNLDENILSSGLVKGSTDLCPQAAKEDPTMARSLILGHLQENGFDTSSLRTEK